MLAILGCASSGPKQPPSSEGEILFDQSASATNADGNFWTIGLKPFAGSDARLRAEQELARLRRLDGLKDAFVLARGPRVIVCIGKVDLRSAPEIYGRRAVYTLQIGVYGRADMKAPTEKDVLEARKKAEEAAAELRRQGELAFYYHGPSMSMVTVGVFGESDIQNSFSLELRDLMERFPHNLVNGQGVSQTVMTTDGREEQMLQPSFPVLIPTQ